MRLPNLTPIRPADLDTLRGGDLPVLGATPILTPLSSINWVLVRPQPDPWRLGSPLPGGISILR